VVEVYEVKSADEIILDFQKSRFWSQGFDIYFFPIMISDAIQEGFQNLITVVGEFEEFVLVLSKWLSKDE
jgi:hypothetical protein